MRYMQEKPMVEIADFPAGVLLRKHVVLVHGTFASTRIWDFARQVFSDDSSVARVSTFGWSGANSQRDRLTAGAELAAFVSQAKTESPELETVLVGHSHGGNVCLHALDSLEEPNLVASIVTMGTPILIATPRPLRVISSAAVYSLGLALVIAMCAFAVLTPSAMQTHLSGNARSAAYTGYAAVLLASVPALFWWLLCAKDRLIEFLEERQNRFASSVGPSLRSVVPMLCCIAPRDEAYIWLNALGRAAALGTTLARIHFDALDRCKAALQRNQMLLMWGWIFSPHVPLVLGALTLIGVPLALGGILFLAFVRSHRYGFGDLGLHVFALFRVRAHSTPPIGVPALVHTITPSGAGLHHSFFYQDRTTLSVVLDWIKCPRVGQAPLQGKVHVALVVWLGYVYFLLATVGLYVIPIVYAVF
jgi:pimeloyl-ACP methyl ester carboxylesterase